METRTKLKTHSALFNDKESAESAYNAAIKYGYKPDEINILMSNATKDKYFNPSVKVETGDKSMEGLALGGALGGTLLGVLGAVIALGSTIAIPGIGLVVAGPLAAGLVGAGTGSIAGGFIGALIGAGIPEEHATIYEKGIKQGQILITITSNSDENEESLLNDWKKYNGSEIY